MSKFAVVFWSQTGHTEAMAEAVANGIKEGGNEVDVFDDATEFNSGLVANYDGIAFGCPATGVESLEEEEFEPMYEEVKGSLNGKKVALFGSYGWGDCEWMTNWAEDCKGAGCVLVADPVTANDEPDDDAIEACVALGKALTA